MPPTFSAVPRWRTVLLRGAWLILLAGGSVSGATDYGDYSAFGSAGAEVVDGLHIGALTDTEESPSTNAAATGDDLSGVDDEDGVTLPVSVVPGASSSLTVNVTNTTGTTALLNVWIDFNGNGVRQIPVNAWRPTWLFQMGPYRLPARSTSPFPSPRIRVR